MTTRIGLVSDTHAPMRLRELPQSLFTALAGVDLVLHAGDVGELWVLDRLGSLAPVIAVHGNDDTADAQRSLPYKSIVASAGVRILLWHSHYEDRQEEFASREEDAFLPKLRRIAAEAISAGATIAVFGHWHIPLVRQVDGVTIVNPGAVASGNAITRQLQQTVARLELNGDGTASIRHANLADLHKPYDPWVDWDAGFKVALRRYSESILAPKLLDRLPSMLAKISQEEQDLLRSLVLPLAHRCWDGEFDLIDENLLRSELAADPSLTADQRLRFQTMLE
jgi:putative phosphoesterase